MDRLKLTSAIRLNLFLAILLLPALLLSACSDSRYDLGRGGAGAAVKTEAAGTERLCVSLAGYRGDIAPENLRAVLNFSQEETASLNGRSAAEEVPVPLYTEEEKAESEGLKADSQAALNYEEEPLPEEEESEIGEDDASAEVSEDAEAAEDNDADEAEADAAEGEECENCDHEHGSEAEAGWEVWEIAEPEEDAAGAEAEFAAEAEEYEPETDEAREAAALEAEAVPEEEAEAQNAAAQSDDSVSAPSGGAWEPAAAGYEGGEFGCVFGSQAVLEAGNTLKLYFDIDRDLFPVRLESLSLCEASDSAEGAFLSYPLQITVEKGGCSVEVGAKAERKAGPDAETAENSGIRLSYADASEGAVTFDKYVYVRVTDLKSAPDSFSLSYTEAGNSTVKTVNTASYKDGMLTFGKIMTDASSVTLKKIEVGAASYTASKTIELSGSAHVEILSFNDFSLNSPVNYLFKFTKPVGSALKLKYTTGTSSSVYTKTFAGSASDYNLELSEEADAVIKSSAIVIVLREVQVNNRYMSCSETLTPAEPAMKYRLDLNGKYADMSREPISYCQSVSGVSSKPSSCRLHYTMSGDSTVYTASGTYDSVSQTVNFRFSADNDVKVTKIYVNSRIYTKNIVLNYVKPSCTVKYANMSYAKLVVKNVKSAANWIAVTYVLSNSQTGASSSTYKKTSGTYSSDAQTYAFSFTPSLLNGSDYDTVVIKSVTLDNSVSVKDRSIAIGKTYNLLYSGLSAQSTRYSVNVYNGTSGVVGRKGTMTYTLPSGKSYTANGAVKYDPVAKRYVMHFETVKTTASSIKVNKVTVGNRYYGSSFTMKYGQNKNASNADEGRNTRTLSMSSGFKACKLTYTVTLTKASSSMNKPTLKWGVDSSSSQYSTKGKYADGKITFTMKTSAAKLNVGNITAGSKKSIKVFTLTPKKLSYSINSSTQMGKKGNKWVSQTCSDCSVKGSGKCKTCKGSGKVACSASKMPGGSKCFYCKDIGKMNCTACAASKKCQTCAGTGKRSVLKAVN